MGDSITTRRVSREDRQRYREKVQLCLDVFEHMLHTGDFDTDTRLTGMEVELNLVDDALEPALVNERVLRDAADKRFTTELARFNIELNVPPRELAGSSAQDLARNLETSLRDMNKAAANHGARVAMTGVLPTLMPEVFAGEWISSATRYAALNDAIVGARGEDIVLDIAGADTLSLYSPSIGPEAACTSVQLHTQVSPREFAPYWNASQLLAGPQLAVGCNSPFLFGRQLWHETRIELFKQATDTRPEELRNQGVRPRVYFGERWITSVFDLFEENSRYFPSLLLELSDEDPLRTREEGGAPQLSELRLHNGTVYRWNRPVYDVVNGRPHLRVENRVLPAGPTVEDTVANALFYYGTVTSLAQAGRPLWSKMSFSTAEENFTECAHHGVDARLYWPGAGEVGAEELIVRKLLPLAHEGLQQWGVDADVAGHYLDIIEQRAVSGQTGSGWQIAMVSKLEDAGLDRRTSLHTMFAHYLQHSENGDPVHTWPTEVDGRVVVPTQRG